MVVEFKIQYNTDTKELIVDGKSLGKFPKMVAAEEVAECFISKTRSAEVSEIIKNACN